MQHSIQCVLFSKDLWTVKSSRKWLVENNFMDNLYDKRGKNIRWKQFDLNPDYRYRRRKVENGITFVYEYRMFKGGDISSPEDAVNAMSSLELLQKIPNKKIIELGNKYKVFAIPVEANNPRIDIAGLQFALTKIWNNISESDKDSIKQIVIEQVENSASVGASANDFLDATGPLAIARKNINSSPDVIAKLPADVQSTIRDYKSFVASGFRDAALETSWQNIKLNPTLVNNNKYRTVWTYIRDKAATNNMFWRWAGKPGQYPLSDEIQDKRGQVVLSADIARQAEKKRNPNSNSDDTSFIKNLPNPDDAKYYNYATLQLFNKSK